MPDSAGKAVSPARQLDESEAAIPRSRAHRSWRQRFRRRERIERAAAHSAARATRESIDSAKINARNPSHFGSKIHVWPAGNSSIRFASIGSIGGFTGRFTLLRYYRDGSE